MYILKFFLLICLLAIKNGYTHEEERISFLGNCSINDATFNSCYANNLKSILLRQNDKPIVSLEPMHIKRAALPDAMSKNIKLSIYWENLIVKGLSKAIFKDARLSKTGCGTELEILLPDVSVYADYSMNGTEFSIKVNSKGKAFYKMKNILVEMRIQYKKLIGKDNGTYIDIEAVKLGLTKIDGLYIHWDVLFGGDGDKEREAQANAKVNENWQKAWDYVMRPAFEETMEPIFLNIFKDIAKDIPFGSIASDKVC